MNGGLQIGLAAVSRPISAMFSIVASSLRIARNWDAPGVALAVLIISQLHAIHYNGREPRFQ